MISPDIIYKRKLYFSSQVTGWFAYVLLAAFANQLSGNGLNAQALTTLIVVFITGIATTHLYRATILKYHWLKLGIKKLIPRVLAAVVVFSVLFHIIYLLLIMLLVQPDIVIRANDVYLKLLNWSALFLIWSLIYFLFHFFENYRKEEIKNLKWEAMRIEAELNKLKSQLNPHFIFNSMNTIRALVDEDPVKAKKSITQLSNILRNTLTMGKNKETSLEDELKLVVDYLEIEQARFEERLTVVYDLDAKASFCKVPPLMIQTLVENAIKHGISKLPKGGQLTLKTQCDTTALRVVITNPGFFDSESIPETGFGLLNTRQRLNLLYGNLASLHIQNTPERIVKTELVIPQTA